MLTITTTNPMNSTHLLPEEDPEVIKEMWVKAAELEGGEKW